MRFRRLTAIVVLFAVVLAAFYLAPPYVRAASLIVRAAKLGGPMESFARDRAYTVSSAAPHFVPTRHGDVPAQFFTPNANVERTVLMLPGINAMGIRESRLTGLATDFAGSGIRVMTLALPDLQRYRITPRATDVIEDAVAWMAARRDLAPDGRVGIIGVSFAGGLAVSAAGRTSIRDRVAFVVSFGGHGDLRRVMRYVATGEAPQVEGTSTQPPHDYAAAVVLYGLADRGAVPPDQVAVLREGIETFLLASQLTVFDTRKADETFAAARRMQERMPEPSASLMKLVNDRAVATLGRQLLPHLDQLGADDPALSPELARPPRAPVYLLHGSDDTVIPTAESALLADNLRTRGADVRLLLTGVITHAEANPAAAVADVLGLIRFWAAVLRE
jgi:dienelactone hydrolase